MAGLIAVRDRYDRAGAIAAGRVWQRLHLDATARGMALQPLNQPIEMIDRERQIGAGSTWARRIGDLTGEDWQATFSFRAGYWRPGAPQPAPPARRRGAELIRPRLAPQRLDHAAAALFVEATRLRHFGRLGRAARINALESPNLGV